MRRSEGTGVIPATATSVAEGAECSIPIESPFQSGGMAVSRHTLSSMAHGLRFRCSWIGETFFCISRVTEYTVFPFYVRRDSFSDTGEKDIAFAHYVNDKLHEIFINVVGDHD